MVKLAQQCMTAFVKGKPVTRFKQENICVNYCHPWLSKLLSINKGIITYTCCCCKTLLHFIVTLTTINMAVLAALSTFCLISIYSSTAEKVFNGKGEIYFTHNYAYRNSGIRVVYRPENYEKCKLVNYLA